MAAILLLDREVLGRLTEIAQRDPVPRDSSIALLERLRAAGLLRTDRTLPELAAVLSAVHHGYFATAPLMPDQLRLADAAAAELLGDTVHRAFARTEPLTPGRRPPRSTPRSANHVTAAAEPRAPLESNSEDPS
jgi:hypothetical protein